MVVLHGGGFCLVWEAYPAMRVLVRQREVVLCTIDFRSTYAIVIYLALLATLVLFCGSELPKPAFCGCAYIHLRNFVPRLVTFMF